MKIISKIWNWRIIPFAAVALLGLGSMWFIENLEPDQQRRPKKQKNSVAKEKSPSISEPIEANIRPPQSQPPPQAPAADNGVFNFGSEVNPYGTTTDMPQDDLQIPTFNRFKAASENTNTDYSPEKDFVKSQIIVLDPGKNFLRAAAEMGFKVIEIMNLEALGMRAIRIQVPMGEKTNAALDRLTGRFPNLTMDLDHNFEPSQNQNRRAVPRRRRARDAPSTAAEQLANRSKTDYSRAQKLIGWENIPVTCGNGVRLGMIDTAVDASHPVLLGQRIETRALYTPKGRSAPADHGTAIAALLIGKPSKDGLGGLLPGAELKAANIFELSETGEPVGHASSFLRAINWLVRMHVDVVNIGLTSANNKMVRKAMKRAVDFGLIVVAAAGNHGLKKRKAYPAGFKYSVAVTAVGPYRGVMRNANRGDHIDFAAPGIRMWTAKPGGGGKFRNGTSYATTYVTALLGLEVLRNRGKDPATLRQFLRSGIIDLGKPGKDDIYGWGFVAKKPQC